MPDTTRVDHLLGRVGGQAGGAALWLAPDGQTVLAEYACRAEALLDSGLQSMIRGTAYIVGRVDHTLELWVRPQQLPCIHSWAYCKSTNTSR